MSKRVPWPVAEGYVAEGGTWRGLRWQITRRAEPSIVRVEHADTTSKIGDVTQ